MQPHPTVSEQPVAAAVKEKDVRGKAQPAGGGAGPDKRQKTQTDALAKGGPATPAAATASALPEASTAAAASFLPDAAAAATSALAEASIATAASSLPDAASIAVDAAAVDGCRPGVTHRSGVLELDDRVVVDGTQLIKPFVLKPVDAENHDIFVYFHPEDGGGSQHVGDAGEPHTHTHARKLAHKLARMHAHTYTHRSQPYAPYRLLPQQPVCSLPHPAPGCSCSASERTAPVSSCPTTQPCRGRAHT